MDSDILKSITPEDSSHNTVLFFPAGLRTIQGQVDISAELLKNCWNQIQHESRMELAEIDDVTPCAKLVYLLLAQHAQASKIIDFKCESYRKEK